MRLNIEKCVINSILLIYYDSTKMNTQLYMLVYTILVVYSVSAYSEVCTLSSPANFQCIVEVYNIGYSFRNVDVSHFLHISSTVLVS